MLSEPRRVEDDDVFALPPSGVASPPFRGVLLRGLVDLATSSQKLLVMAVASLLWGDEGNPRMSMFGVVPVDESVEPRSSVVE